MLTKLHLLIELLALLVSLKACCQAQVIIEGHLRADELSIHSQVRFGQALRAVRVIFLPEVLRGVVAHFLRPSEVFLLLAPIGQSVRHYLLNVG